MIKLLCYSCKNYIVGNKCLAFVDGIPKEIINGMNNHKKPLPNQGNDIVFEEEKEQTKI